MGVPDSGDVVEAMNSAWIKKAVSFLSFQTGITPAALRLQQSLPFAEENRFCILNYHRVNDFNDPFTIDSVITTDFDAQMRYISKHYSVLSLEDIQNRIQRNIPLPRKCLAVTFDDGYADNYTFAFPILKKYDLPATIFLTAGCIDTPTPLWFDQILSGFKGSDRKQFCCPLTSTVYDIQDPTQKLLTAHATLEQLKKAGNENRKAMIPEILSDLGISDISPLKNRSGLLTWPWIKQMSQSNISFGSHTMTHPILSDLPAADLNQELTKSRVMIENHLDKPVYFFAYPNGKKKDFNDRVTRAVKHAGYLAAVTTEPDVNTPASDPFIWGRYKPWQNQVEHFAMNLFLHGLTR